jgi:putative SOS response-associated peptidase YedK
MCGRYHLKNPAAVSSAIKDLFGIDSGPIFPRYNVAPSQFQPIVARSSDGKIETAQKRWGFVPFWEKSAKPKIAPINARAEEALSKPMFRQAIQKRRCLVPADGFYEWQKRGTDEKQPMEIHLHGFKAFFFAGIFEGATAIHPETFLLFTTKPNDVMKPIHNRMPVILEGEVAKAWIFAESISDQEMAEFSAPIDSDGMEVMPVSRLVNNPRNDSIDCLVPL